MEKELDNKQKFWLIFTGIICITIISLLTSTMIYCASCHKQMIEAGWTRKTIIGSEYPQWVKE